MQSVHCRLEYLITTRRLASTSKSSIGPEEVAQAYATARDDEFCRASITLKAMDEYSLFITRGIPHRWGRGWGWGCVQQVVVLQLLRAGSTQQYALEVLFVLGGVASQVHRPSSCRSELSCSPQNFRLKGEMQRTHLYLDFA